MKRLHVNPINGSYLPGQTVIDMRLTVNLTVDINEPEYQSLREIMGDWGYYMSRRKPLPDSYADITLNYANPGGIDLGKQSFTKKTVFFYFFGWEHNDPPATLYATVDASIPTALSWGGTVRVDARFAGVVKYVGSVTTKAWLRETSSNECSTDADCPPGTICVNGICVPDSRETVSLTIKSAAGGTTDPTPGVYTFNKGDTAVVTAIPDDGYYFVRYGYDGEVSENNPIELVMDKDYSLVPVFQVTGQPPPPPPPPKHWWEKLTTAQKLALSLTGIGVVLSAYSAIRSGK